MKNFKALLLAAVIISLGTAAFLHADPFTLDPGVAIPAALPTPVLVDTNNKVAFPTNGTLTIPTLFSTNINAGYGKDGSSVRSGSGVFGGVTNAGAALSVIDASGNANGMFSIIKAGSGAGTGPVFAINNDKSASLHSDVTIDSATNGRPDLYITHVTSNATNAFEVRNDAGGLMFSLGANKSVTMPGSVICSNGVTINGPLTFGGVLTCGQTNDISSSPSAPIAWLTIVSTNGTTYKLGLYAN